MGAPDLLHALQDQGLSLWAEGERLLVGPKARITDETRRFIREHKAELLQALSADSLPDTSTEARRQRVLSLLAAHPETRYAVVTDLKSDPDAVLVSFAIRGQATCELTISREKWDGVLFLELLEKHCATGLLH